MQWLIDDGNSSGLVVFPTFPPLITASRSRQTLPAVTQNYVASVVSGEVKDVPFSKGVNSDIMFRLQRRYEVCVFGESMPFCS